MSVAVGFTGAVLDRADHERDDPQALTRALGDCRARLLKLDGLDPQLDGDGQLVWTSLADLPDDAQPLLLGYIAGRSHFVPLRQREAHAPVRSPALFHMLGLMPPGQAGLYAAARSLVDWHQRHGFCANCGSATAIHRAGWARRCAGCAAEHFPRTDPVVIMLAEHDGRALVARQASWPAGRYSALAGFVEVGESIEEAVAREVLEEAGVRVGNVRYIASQPWPFPSSLMIACVAQAEDDALTLDTNELEDGFWITREEARAALAGDPAARFGAPPPYAIAHSLLRHWADGE
ncbi:NAD(+) diphosphatase [Sphingomonas turrisvirgatae]|uniref:NAD(+) diphosphatase n=1 Tax=Sphingomonas turrisvirgatae TaxID=1888892 RepID=A0A1E3M0M2_9SPHN|nr:NAD(+) diphosphatase [Sphingomonas turrisvirgatae]ODP39549.1 NADH pyrophosphatase [Sphingomonas turrisvirgatae]